MVKMNYKIFIDFSKENDIIQIKDSIGFYGIREIYGINEKNIEKIKKEIFNSIDLMIDYYVKKCEENQDEAN